MAPHRPSVPIHDSLDTPSQRAHPGRHDHPYFSCDRDRFAAFALGHALLSAPTQTRALTFQVATQLLPETGREALVGLRPTLHRFPCP